MSKTAIDVTYRLATLADLELALNLMQEFYAIERIQFQESWTRPVLTEFLQNETYGQFWLVEANQAIAGYGIITFGYSLELGGRDALLDELYLRPAFQGQGLGSQMLELMETACRRQGIKVLSLVVDHHNPKARSLYERSGFRQPTRDILHKWLEPQPSMPS
ncbi:MAG: GNAT family N-acetyltransferase [Elainellaceae cyanobacterium]